MIWEGYARERLVPCQSLKMAGRRPRQSETTEKILLRGCPLTACSNDDNKTFRHPVILSGVEVLPSEKRGKTEERSDEGIS